MRKLHNLITKIEPPNWVNVILALTFILRIPSFFSPYYYGDEMIYLTLGNGIRKGFTLYSQIHDNKPPFLYLVASVSGNLFWFRAILTLWMLVTIIIFWHLMQHLFEKNKKAQIVAVSAFAILTTIPLFEGQIANAELFLIGPIILGILLLLKNNSYKNIIFAGLSFSVAALFKVPAVFDLGVIVAFWLIKSTNSKNLIDIIKKTLILLIAFAIPILLSFLWYYFHGALSDYFRAAFLANIGYLSTWNGDASGSFVTKHGPLLIRAGVVLIGLILLRLKNKNLSKAFLIGAIWILTSLFAVTLSERPYPHYIIQAVPALSILIAILVTSERFEQVLTIIPFTFTLFALIYYHFWYYPTVPYYSNFVSYITQNETKNQYYTNIDANSVDNYETSKIILNTTTANDRIFVWGDAAPTIYALTNRISPIKYVADYHITDFSTLKEVASKLENTPPTLIVILKNSPSFPELKKLLARKYILIDNSGSTAEIWHFTAN